MSLNSAPATAMRNVSLLLRHAPNRVTAQFMRYHSTSSSSPPPPSSSSVSSEELRHFASLANSWWDPLGPSRILHLMNPVRHDFITSCLEESRSQTQSRFRSSSGGDSISSETRDNSGATSSSRAVDNGLKYLDVGCGGGIFAESLARTIPLSDNDTSSSSSSSSSSSPANNNNNNVASSPTRASSLLAIDPSSTMIDLALSHARKDPTLRSHLHSGKFCYENISLEDLVSKPNSASSSSASASASASPPSFDVITLFEVLEHTSSPRAFLAQCLRLLNPGGWLVGSTIARTWPSFVVNQVVAEAPWPIGVVPRGTHDWSKFVNVDEVKGWAQGEVAEMRKRADREEESGAGMEGAGGDESGGPGRGKAADSPAAQMGWRCIGAVYVPGLGWKLVPGAEAWGNYFWGIQKTVV